MLNDSAHPASVISWEDLPIAVSGTENTFRLKDFCERFKGNNKILGTWKEFTDTLQHIGIMYSYISLY